ncbi:tyrosine-type recombinase/integrase [Lysinibacillus sp. Bpr_S20]|uniref:tyrosine-type recombinase/integrase n=1 Tax=Lysinibacillus sp. Bpr_S20 TaxID=2933964 RepID=UPI002010C8BF|nr:tyrosine-type recombinase/integrase [Lysinibacillus sp. Bpr_S20]MCL1700626.1 tyrosine-type recombinase/integrase [Lysinibacillus sp. Bpr_S20]
MSISPFLIEVDRYMLDCSAKGLSPKTLKSYEQTLRLFARYLFDNFEIDDVKSVKAEHVRAYIRSIEERGKFEVSADETPVNYPERRGDFGKPVSKTTIANYVRNIKAFYSHLYSEQLIRSNPLKDLKNVKPERKIKVMLEDNELKQFFRSFDVTKFDQYRDWVIARLIFDTGARIGELLEVVVSDIDLRGNALLLRKTKNSKQRFVYYSEKTRKHLRSWLAYKDRYSDSSYVFPTNRGTKLRIEGVERSFRLRSKDVGLQVTPHLLRNNFAKRYLVNGGDLATLSRLLGHASVDITAQIYLDFADKEVMKKYRQHSPLENLNI